MSEKVIPENELKEAVKRALIELLGVTSQERSHYPTMEAYKLLGYSSPKQLYAAVYTGILRVGHEVQDRRGPTNSYPKYYFDIEKCLERLNKLPEQRE